MRCENSDIHIVEGLAVKGKPFGIIIRTTEMVVNKLAKKRDNVRERVGGIMGGRVLDLDVLRLKHAIDDANQRADDAIQRADDANQRADDANQRADDAKKKADYANLRADKAEREAERLRKENARLMAALSAV